MEQGPKRTLTIDALLDEWHESFYNFPRRRMLMRCLYHPQEFPADAVAKWLRDECGYVVDELSITTWRETNNV